MRGKPARIPRAAYAPAGPRWNQGDYAQAYEQVYGQDYEQEYGQNYEQDYEQEYGQDYEAAPGEPPPPNNAPQSPPTPPTNGTQPPIDASNPPEHIERLRRTLEQFGREARIHVFPGADHGYFNDTRGRYDERAARASWALALAFLRETLGVEA